MNIIQPPSYQAKADTPLHLQPLTIGGQLREMVPLVADHMSFNLIFVNNGYIDSQGWTCFECLSQCIRLLTTYDRMSAFRSRRIRREGPEVGRLPPMRTRAASRDGSRPRAAVNHRLLSGTEKQSANLRTTLSSNRSS